LFGGGDPNLFGYVLSDPINSIDPEGLNGNRIVTLRQLPERSGGGGGGFFWGSRRLPIKGMEGANLPAEIGGRQYTGHALDRMQGRGIPPSVVENTIQKGQCTPQDGGKNKYYDPENKVTVIIGNNGQVISIWPGK
jgi:hypothetical protein